MTWIERVRLLPLAAALLLLQPACASRAPPSPRGEAAGKRPVLVVLHGMCAMPEWVCQWFPDGMGSGRWVVCPRAQSPCQGGGATWDTGGSNDVILASLAKLKEKHAEEVADGDGVLFGFSQGTVVALDAAV